MDIFTFMLLLNPTTPCLDAQYVGEDNIGTIPNIGEEFSSCNLSVSDTWILAGNCLPKLVHGLC